MTAFTSAMLPTSTRAIATFEELSIWAAQVLYSANTTARMKRTPDFASELIARVGVLDDADGILRWQAVVLPRFDLTKQGLLLPDWKQVSEISTMAASANLIG